MMCEDITRYFGTALLGVMLFFATGLHAQIERGDFYFERFEYGLALEAYEFAYNEQNIQNPYLSRKLALTYRMLGDMSNSRIWYAKTLHRDKSNPIDMLYLAEALKFDEEYVEAMRWYKKYNDRVPDDRRAVHHIEDAEYVAKLCEDSIYYNINSMEVNTPNPEFGITKYKSDYLVSYVGVVNPELGNKYLKKEDQQSLYSDVFVFYRGDDNQLHVDDWLGGGINSKYHDGPVAYDHANKEMVITRNNVKKGKLVTDAKGKANLKLLIAKEVDGEFQKPVELPFNSTDFSNAHPAVSPDGKTLFFSSNRDGGKGATDLYYCTRENDSWSAPKNLGSVINTEGEEVFPHMGDDGYLYFSSTGHAGLGGLDIFRTRRLESGWTKPENVGAPVNSSRDDFGVLVDESGKAGYFSSNRGSEAFDDDLYYFEYDFSITVRGKVTDDSDLSPLENAIARLYDMDGNLIFEEKTDVDGYYDFKIQPHECNYRLEIGKGKDFSVENVLIEHCDNRLGVYDQGDISLTELTYLAVGAVREKETENPIENFRITLYNEETGEELRRMYTDETGEFQFSLRAETDYKMTFQKDDWFAKSAEFTTKGMAPGILEIDKYVSLLFEQIEIEKAIVVDNIYYDYNKFFIREDAKPELDKIVKMMEDNPSMYIELSSHTDSRGGDKFNLALSDMRAKSAVQYIIAMGIEADRILSKGYGETALRNHCSNGISCSEAAHQENRRTEFKVLKY